MATIFDVAKYITTKTGNISPIKLQKLLYYSQAWTLAWDEAPLFNEDFEAWADSPVCVELYELHKGKFSVDKSSFSNADICNLTESEKENVDIVLRDYGDKDSQWLTNLIQLEAPWENARKNIPIGARGIEVITKDAIQDYYLGLYTDKIVSSCGI